MNRLFCSMLAVCLVAVPVAGQESTAAAPQAPKYEATTSQTHEDATHPDAMQLSLEEAIATASRENLGVELVSYDVGQARENARGAHGIFDALTSATINTGSENQPVASTLESSQSDLTVANFGVQQLVPTGGLLALGFNNSRSENNNPNSFVNPSYRSGLGLSFDQPLLRNFGVDITRRGILIARNNLGINQQQFRSTMMSTVLEVVRAYYDLIYARENLEVQRQSRALAVDQERIVQIRIDVGASAPLDILEPRVAIATREESVIAAEAGVRAAEDRLRQLMNLPPEAWDRPIIPSDRVEYQPMAINMEESVARAIQLRPEIEQLDLGIDTQRINYLYARNQVLPRLDFNLDYGFAGLAGREMEIDPVTELPTGRFINNDYFDAFNQVADLDFDRWTVGVTFGMPVRNVQAKAEQRRAELDLRQSATDRDRVEQNIAVQVRQAARDIDTLAKQIGATRAARDAAERNLDAERKRFDNGMTTNFQVLEAQQRLSDARSREILALVSYQKAVANYHTAVGDILEAHRISVNEDMSKMDFPESRLSRYSFLNYGNYTKADEEALSHVDDNK